MRSLRSCLRTATIAALSTLSLAAASLGSIAVPPANATLTSLSPAATGEESVQDILNDDTDEDEGPQSNASQSGDQDEGDDALSDEEDEELEETVPSKSLLSSPQPFAARGSGSSLPDPVNPGTKGNKVPTVTSTWTPGGTVTSGTPTTLKITYKNSAGRATNVRVWHQYMVEADHTTKYTVTCTASGNGTCPGTLGMPEGEQTINGKGGQVYNTFWGDIDIATSGTVVFTITLTTVLNQEDPCDAQQTVPANAWARASSTGFTVPDDVGAGTHDLGYITATACPAGAVKITNTVRSPVNPTTGMPGNALSQDETTFTATWENISGSPVTLPIYYSYLLEGEGNETTASWTCTTTGSGSCPLSFGIEGEMVSDGTSVPQRVFGSNPEDLSTFVTLAAGQKLSYDITLSTTLQDCTPEGYYEVETYTNRGALTGEVGVRTSTPSGVIQLGCADWVLEESFAGETADEPGWQVVEKGDPDVAGRACLTRAPGNGTGTTLGGCGSNTVGSPSTGFSPDNSGFPETSWLPDGYLQLTSDKTWQVGAVVYNRPIPAKNGLVAEFTQYQFGRDTNAGDGIGFFLADGTVELETVGADGGGLGYANKGPVGESGSQAGLPAGYFGLGFDVRGNYAATSDDVAPQCPGESGGQKKTPSL